ncbi:MAG TPA: DoxX family protein [Candidatus Lustribacter sp.]|nr:DoxX family protein [Candidatus Lustribacter sp.]
MTQSGFLKTLTSKTTLRTGIALLILRLVVGWSLHLHGAPKLGDPLHWLDNSPSLHAAVPGAPEFLEPIVAVAEGIGGLFIMAGLLTRVFAFFIVCDLSTAVIGVGIMQHRPFVGRDSYEIPALLLTAAIVLLIAGPGRISLDALLARREWVILRLFRSPGSLLK